MRYNSTNPGCFQHSLKWDNLDPEEVAFLDANPDQDYRKPKNTADASAASGTVDDLLADLDLEGGASVETEVIEALSEGEIEAIDIEESVSQAGPEGSAVRTAGLDVTMAPGCFSIGLFYRPGSDQCKTCPFAAQCAPLAREQVALFSGVTSHADGKRELDRKRQQRHRSAKSSNPVPESVTEPSNPAPSSNPVTPSNPVPESTGSSNPVLANAVIRKAALLAATARKGDKVTQQLRGRETQIVKIWLIRQLEPRLSANGIAARIGDNLTKGIVRGRLDTIAKLESPGGVWHGL